MGTAETLERQITPLDDILPFLSRRDRVSLTEQFVDNNRLTPAEIRTVAQSINRSIEERRTSHPDKPLGTFLMSITEGMLTRTAKDKEIRAARSPRRR